ncbi:MAG: hypothetical protein JJU02_12580 [Cryomorphaceae bacterium]|nr:hypothetical protein [Cryomorphaceae bacterium]
MALNKKKTYKNLKKKGFVDSTRKSDDHLYLELFHEGKLVLYTKISHGSSKDIGKSLISQMARQCNLNTNDFKDLANCPLSKEAYYKILDDNDYLE